MLKNRPSHHRAARSDARIWREDSTLAISTARQNAAITRPITRQGMLSTKSDNVIAAITTGGIANTRATTMLTATKNVIWTSTTCARPAGGHRDTSPPQCMGLFGIKGCMRVVRHNPLKPPAQTVDARP